MMFVKSLSNPCCTFPPFPQIIMLELKKRFIDKIINDGDGKENTPETPEAPETLPRVYTPLPFDGNFHLTQAFGENPSMYRRFKLPGHNGLDWGMPEGQKIMAVDEGFVMSIEERPQGFGRYVKIQHEWGQSLYAHLSEFKVVLNQPVQQGDVIALSGNTGNSTGPHLHFGMRIKPYSKVDGWYGYTNPQRYLQWPAAGQPSRKSSKDTLEILAFQLQEVQMQGDLWQEQVYNLLQRYLPGDIPPDADLLATLENLMDSWHEELETLRGQTIAKLFKDGPTAL